MEFSSITKDIYEISVKKYLADIIKWDFTGFTYEHALKCFLKVHTFKSIFLQIFTEKYH